MRNQDVLASDGQVHKEEERGEQASVHSNRNFIGPGHFSEMVRVMRVSEGVRGAHNYRKCPLPNLVFRLDIDRRCFPVNCITKVRRDCNLSLTCDVRPSVAGAQRRCRRRRR